jgi:hypothetical protein
MSNGETVGAALVRNFTWVAQSARAFAQAPQPANLISLKPGLSYGQWRDSQDGLAGGRYPFDVNVAFVPAAMAAIEKFVLSGMLEPYLSPATSPMCGRERHPRCFACKSARQTRAGRSPLMPRSSA